MQALYIKKHKNKMLEHYVKKYKEYDVFFLDVELFYKYIKQFYNILSSIEKEKADSIMNQKHKKIYITRHGLVRYAVCRYINCEPKDVRLYKDNYGKPYVDGNNIYFNISHSKNILAVVISQKRNVGIDVQYIKKKCDIKLFQDEILSWQEEKMLNSTEDEEQKRELFFDMWSRKEAFSKCLGLGFTMDLRNVSLLKESVIYNQNTYKIVSGLVKKDCIYSIVVSV